MGLEVEYPGGNGRAHHDTPCDELIGLRDKVAKEEKRLSATIDANAETARLMHTVAERVGVMRPDGTATPHSLTSAVQQLGNQVMLLKRAIEERAPTSSPPPDYDEGEITRVQDRPTIYRRAKAAERTASRQRFIGAAAGLLLMVTTILGAIARAKGWLP